MCNSDENKRRLLAEREALLSQLDQMQAEIARLEAGCGSGSFVQDCHSKTASAEHKHIYSADELLEIEARERREVGQNLHDALGQHLVGILWLMQSLVRTLESEGSACASDAQEIVSVVKQTIELTRSLAQSLRPVELNELGLASALDQLASTTSKLFRVACHFKCDMKEAINNKTTAEHVYRIAQESITNAIKHSGAKCILVTLSSKGHHAALTVEHDGRGFPDDYDMHQGMGLRTMACRAKIIGGVLDIETAQEGKVVVSCPFILEEN